MKGLRVYPTKETNFNLNAGEYGLCEGTWFACTPNGHLGNLSEHEVEEHPDGTITVSPSILVTIPNYGKSGVDKELWHGYLKAGVWQSV